MAKKKAQDGAEVKSFFKEYLKSDNYKKRLKTQGYENPEETIKDRLGNVSTTRLVNVTGAGSQYIPETKVINIDKDELNKYNLPIQSTVPHEYSHAAGSMLKGSSRVPNQNLTLNVNETTLINSKNKYRKIDTGPDSKLPIDERMMIDHDALSSEAKANIDALRFKLWKDKIYNTGKQEFNKDFLKKAKEKYKNDKVLNRNFEAFSDEDLIYLMNNVATNSTDINTNDMANSGTRIKKAQGGVGIPKPKRINPNVPPEAWELPNPYEDREQALGAAKPMPNPYEQSLKNIGAYREQEAYTPDEGLMQAHKQWQRKDKFNNFIEGTNWGNVALGALSAVDALIPNDKAPYPVVRPTNSYNPYPYGTGSQAIAKDGITVSSEGYRQGPPPAGTNYRIPSNRVSMKGIKTPIIGTGSDGTQQIMMPEEEYVFPNAEYVDEEMAKKGKKVKGPYMSKSYQGGGTVAAPKFNTKEFAVRKGHFQGEDAYTIGDPKFVDEYGRPATGAPPAPRTYEPIPSYVTNVNWDPTKNVLSYEDQTGYLKEGDPTLLNHPRFRNRATNVVTGQLVAPPTNTGMASLKKGGRLKANNGLQIEGNKFTPLSSETLMINGNSHEKGGTDISYGGKVVEAEAGEPISIMADSSAVVFGNKVNPLTKNKFKTDATTIGKKEAKVNKLMDYSTALVNKTNPFDKWGSLKFSAGVAMMTGAYMKKQELASAKEHLASLQEAVLQLDGDEQVIARNGMKIKAQMGYRLPQGRPTTIVSDLIGEELEQPIPAGTTQSMAQRHNNPGNIKFAKWLEKYGAVKGDPGTDGGHFAKFPDVESGKKAMVALLTGNTYKNLTVEQAAKRWTGGAGYNNIPDALKSLKVKDLSEDQMKLALDTFTLGEDSKKYNWEGVDNPVGQKRTTTPQTPYEAGRVVAPEFTPVDEPKKGHGPMPDYPYNWSLSEIKNIVAGTDAEPLQFQQILPELYAAATNQVEPVHMQQFNPELFQPYNVSLQDRRNQITGQGRASRQYLGDNANAQAALAAGEYQAINQVDAEEFRINQGIAQDIVNKNKSLLNEAQGKNLGLADLQYTRQTKAKSNTKQTNQAILNSVSNKVLQNQLENRTLQVYENLYPHFRYGDNYGLQKEGPPGQAYLTIGSPGQASTNTAATTKSTLNPDGSLKSQTITQQSDLKTAIEEARLEAIRLNNSPLNLQGYFNRNRSSMRKRGIGI